MTTVNIYPTPTSVSLSGQGIKVTLSGQGPQGPAGPAGAGLSSVGLQGDGVIFNTAVTNSPLTGTGGTMQLVLATQSANTVLAGPASGGSALAAFRALTAADIPFPTSTSIGGVKSLGSSTNQFLYAISIAGTPLAAQPSFANLSGTAASAQIPFPTSTSIGGIQSSTGVTNQFVSSISTAGVPGFTQPSFSNLSGTAVSGQIPFPTSTSIGGIQSSTGVTNQWVSSISTAGIPGFSQPNFTNIAGTASVGQGGIGISSAAVNQLIKGNGTNGFLQTPITVGTSGELFNYRANVALQTSTAYTLTTADNGMINEFNTGLPTVTLSTALGTGFNTMIVQAGTGQVTIGTSAAASLVNASSFTKTRAQWAEVTLYCRSGNGGTATYVMGGDGA